MLTWAVSGRPRRRAVSSSRRAISGGREMARDRKSTRLNSSHTEIYTLSLHDALPIFALAAIDVDVGGERQAEAARGVELPAGHLGRPRDGPRSEEHTSELQSHRDLHSFPTRRSSDLRSCRDRC